MDIASRLLNFSWVENGALAGCRGPHSGTDLEMLHSLGIRALVRLAKEADISPEQVKAAGLEDCYEPIPDWHAPSQAQIDRVLKFVVHKLKKGGPIAISCGAGYGRTGTILACYFVANGLSAPEALKHLTSIRPQSKEVLDIPEQTRAVEEFEKRFRAGTADLSGGS